MPALPLKPYWTTADRETVRLYHGNVTDVLARMPEGSVQCCVTSPPYWGLRDYGTAEWQGGSPTCDHVFKPPTNGVTNSPAMNPVGDRKLTSPPALYRGRCGKCGAVRTDFQIGSEPAPDCGTWGQAQCGACFVCSMVKVFRGVRRVLRDDGVLWLNLGDSYATGGRGVGSGKQLTYPASHQVARGSKAPSGLKDGNLCGVPWRVALALQADGWVLRSDLPWVKRSCMPESAQNRPAKGLEYVFLLTKRKDYFFDMEAVRKRAIGDTMRDGFRGGPGTRYVEGRSYDNGADAVAGGGNVESTGSRNFRNTDLWFESVDGPHGLVGLDDELVGLDVTSRGYPGRHFAVYPEFLIEPLIKAGTSEKGACAKCGAPWQRMVEKEASGRTRDRAGGGLGTEHRRETHGLDPVEGEFREGVSYQTTGWQPTCECHGRFVKERRVVVRPVSLESTFGENEKKRELQDISRSTLRTPKVGNRDRSLESNRNGISGSLDGVPRDTEEVEEDVWVYVPEIPLEDHPVRPCRVLDPFIGSGTTCMCSLRLGRWSWGIDLSEEYLREHAVKRVGERLIEVNGPGELVAPAAGRVEW